jgi:DNA-directed RNA polymerase specialized sigma24 family protein
MRGTARLARPGRAHRSIRGDGEAENCGAAPSIGGKNVTNDRDRNTRERDMIRGAIHDETALHTSQPEPPRSGQSDEEVMEALLGEHAAVLIGAIVGAGKRLVREDPSAASEEARRYATMADNAEAKIPVPLRRLWRQHYVDGLTPAACAAASGVDMAAVEQDYRELARVLRSVMPTLQPARLLEATP